MPRRKTPGQTRRFPAYVPDTRNYHMASNDGKEHGRRHDGKPGCRCEEISNDELKETTNAAYPAATVQHTGTG